MLFFISSAVPKPPQKLKCADCPFVTSVSVVLLEHTRMHQVLTEFRCPHCSFRWVAVVGAFVRLCVVALRVCAPVCARMCAPVCAHRIFLLYHRFLSSPLQLSDTGRTRTTSIPAFRQSPPGYQLNQLDRFSFVFAFFLWLFRRRL